MIVGGRFMKKRIIIFSVLGALVLCLIVCSVCYFSVDRTAERAAEGSFIIKGEKYIPISIGFTEEGKTIAKADGFDIMEIPEDGDRNFLTVRSALDNWTIVKESYKIPAEGEAGVAYLWQERVTGGVKFDMVQSILDENYQGSFTVKSESESEIYSAAKSIYVGYGDCPVGTEWIGEFGNINGYLVFIKAADMKDQYLTYTCYILKDEYQGLFQESVHKTFPAVEEG